MSEAAYSISIIGKLEGSISHEKIIEEFRNAKRELLAYEFVKPDPLRYLFPCPKYQPAKPYPWDRIGCNGHNMIETVHFNSEQHITPWQPPFSWYPRWSPSFVKTDFGQQFTGFIRCPPVYTCQWTQNELKELGYNCFAIVKEQVVGRRN